MTGDAQPFRWWRAPGARGVSHSVRRSTLDAALARRPVRRLHAVHLSAASHPDPAT